jgi:predicted transcriptional regulator
MQLADYTTLLVRIRAGDPPADIARDLGVSEQWVRTIASTDAAGAQRRGVPQDPETRD